MNGDTVRGEVNGAVGEAKQQLGQTTGDKTMQASGRLDQVKGVVQKPLGAADGCGKHGIGGPARTFARV